MEICFHVIVSVLILTGMLLFLFRLPQAKNVILRTARGCLAVFAPLLWACFFSLLLEPLVTFCQKKYEDCCSLLHRSRIQNRKIGTLLAYFAVALFICGVSMLVAHRMDGVDFEKVMEQLIGYFRQMGDILVLLNLKLAEYGILHNVEGLLSAWTEQGTLWLETKLESLTDILPELGGSLLDIAIGAAVAFYFLMEKDKIKGICRAFSEVCLGTRFTNIVRAIFHEVYSIFSNYLSGQLTDAVIMAVLFSTAFLIVGLPQAVLLGMISGFSNLIPYFGAIMAFLLAVFSGLVSGTPMKALYASILILLLQQVDSLFVVPRAIGKRVALHPALVLLSLAVFGRLLGFWGLLFAVPLGAILKSLLCWIYRKRKMHTAQER